MKTKVIFFAAALLLAGMTLFAPIYMNYVKIEGVAGDSKAPGYQGWLDASTISFAAPAGGAQAAAKCSTHEIVVVKQTDKASPKLSQFCATGKHFPAVTIAVAGERHLLQDAVVKSVQDTQMADGSVREVMTLNFARCATHDSKGVIQPAAKDKIGGSLDPGIYPKQGVSPNAILIGLTPRPESAAVIGLLFNGDGHATLTRKAGGTNPFAQALSTRQVIPSLTLTLNNGQKWTFTNVTVGGFTGGVKPGTESLSLNFTKVEGPPAGFQDVGYKE